MASIAAATRIWETMNCGLCKRPISGNERYVIDHYKCSADLAQSFRDDIAKVGAQRDKLRTALVGLVGVSELGELEQLEGVMRLMPAPAQDKAATIDAIHALIAIAKAEGKVDG